MMDVQSQGIAVRHCHLGTDAEREATGGYRPWIRDSCRLVGWPRVGPCAFPHLPCGSSKQLSALGRHGGSQLGVLAALWEEDPGTPWKAVASFWEVGDA